MNKIETLIALVSANKSLSLVDLIKLSGMKQPQVVGCLKSLVSKGVDYNKETKTLSIAETLQIVKEKTNTKIDLVKDLIAGVLRSSSKDLDNTWLFAIVGASANRAGFKVSRKEFDTCIVDLV